MTKNHEPGSVLALVPAWNAEDFIERTLHALAAQTYPNLRILISDDASTDSTVEICQEFVQRDRRFSLLQQPVNLGWVENVNALLRASQADYLLFAFHDDVLLPDYVSKCVSILEANERAIVAYSDMVTFYQNGDQQVGRFTAIERIPSRIERAKLMLWRPDHWWAPNRGVFRACAAAHIGGMKKNLAGEFRADLPWLVHMMLLGEAIRIPEVLVKKYYQDRSVSRAWNYSPLHQLANLLACAREIHGARLSVKETLKLDATLLRLSAKQFASIGTREVRVRGYISII